MILLIEAFEAEFYQPAAELTPNKMLQFLMEQQGLTVADLKIVLGSEAIATATLSGDHELSISQVKALSQLLKVSPEVFL